MAKTKAGEANCPVCDNRIVWRLSDSGALSCFCQDCDFQGYAKDGTEAKGMLMAKIGAAEPTPITTPYGLDKPKPEAKPAKPEPKPEPEKKSAFQVFGL